MPDKVEPDDKEVANRVAAKIFNVAPIYSARTMNLRVLVEKWAIDHVLTVRNAMDELAKIDFGDLPDDLRREMIAQLATEEIRRCEMVSEVALDLKKAFEEAVRRA